MSIYGPLTPLQGEWEGNAGVDVSLDHDDRTMGETMQHTDRNTLTRVS